MKIFLSWSGETSHKVALVLREWLPSVIQSIQPYVSSEDIDKGARWSSDIAKELEKSKFGIICITKENINAPWINFEAGALSKTIEKTYVCPFLFGVKKSEISNTSPLLQFQSTIYQYEDVQKLLLSINSANDSEKLEDARLIKAFEIWWPNLQKGLDAIFDQSTLEEKVSKDNKSKGNDNAILEEILELSRSQQKLLKSPEDLLPERYFMYIFRRLGYFPIDHPVWEDVNYSLDKVMNLIELLDKNDNIEINHNKLLNLLKLVSKPLKYLSRVQFDWLKKDIDNARIRRLPHRPSIMAIENSKNCENT